MDPGCSSNDSNCQRHLKSADQVAFTVEFGRDAISAGEFDAYRGAVLGGSPPWSAG